MVMVVVEYREMMKEERKERNKDLNRTKKGTNSGECDCCSSDKYMT